MAQLDCIRRLGKAAAVAAFSCTALAPVTASASSAEYFLSQAKQENLPQLLNNADRSFYRSAFAALDRQDWATVQRAFAERSTGPLHGVLLAEFYLHANSPRVELPAIEYWLTYYSNLPQAPQLVSLGQKRGLVSAPTLPREQSFRWQGSAPKRIRPKRTDDGTMPASIRRGILNHIDNDNPDGARVLLDGIDASLSGSARAEWRQRVAWSYYIENQDAAALAMAKTVGQGTGAWVAEGEWVAGLAAWRLGDFEEAASSFHRAGNAAQNVELSAAGFYWAARAYVRARKPEYSNELLRGAARHDETLYGMLAAEQLGVQMLDRHSSADFSREDMQRLQGVENAQVAMMLAEIGEDTLADEVLRHQAKIGDSSQFAPLSRLARALGSPQTQLWMSQYGPSQGRADPAARYPVARWQPVNGWKVDPALAYAHTLQESNFRAKVISPAGARGLMQIMPAAAKDHARTIGVRGTASDLSKPEVNLAFGQEHLNMLNRSPATQGRLPKIMAAYNAGLTPITRWNSEVRDQGDPLLYMESLPYWETRGYVAIVMRNFWMYQRQAGGDSPSRVALAQGQWPGFPELGRPDRVYLSGGK